MKNALFFLGLTALLAACTPAVSDKNAHLSAQTVHTQSDASLAGDWKVVGLSQNGRSAPLGKGASAKILVKDGEMTLRTQPGCNSLIADLRAVAGGKWKSGGLSATRMLCSGNEATAERFATDLLNDSLTVQSTAHELRLIGKNGEMVLRR